MKKLETKDIVPNLGFKIVHKDMSLPSLHKFISGNQYQFDFDVFLDTKNINLQRPFVWELNQKQEFILSVLKEQTIPQFAIVVYGDDHRLYKVIDGKQRLCTLISFYKGEFPIEVNNIQYYYEDLDSDLQLRIKWFSGRCQMAYSYPDDKISDDDLIKWFYLLNFAGTPQEKQHLTTLLSI